MSQSQHSGPAARRYARALFELARESRRLVEVEAQLEALAELATDAEFRLLLQDPRLSDASKANAVGQYFGDTIDPLMKGLLALLQKRKRMALLIELPAAFFSLADASAGRVRGTLQSACELGAPELAAIEQSLSQGTGLQVSLETEVDPSLLGGVRVTLAGTCYDGSARGRLDQITKRLATAELG
jgi:F-type H+-transporting ATPase subunit delta